MKKTYLLLLVLIFTAGLALAQNPADEEYIKAMTSNDPCQRVQLLKEYISKYAGKGTQYENYAYAQLCLTGCPSKSLQDSINYGEKALNLGGLDDVTKCQVLLVLGGAYAQQGQNLDKAKNYANQVIEIGKANKNKEGASPEQWNKFIGAGYFTLGSIAEKRKDTAGAVEAYLSAYSLLKKPEIMGLIKKMGKEYYDAQNYAEAEKVFRAIYNLNKDPEMAILLAQLLLKSNKNDEALSLLKEAYGKKKNGDVAYSIAIILAKKAQTDPSAVNEAIRYSLEAAFLSPKNSEQAMKMAQGLFFTMNKDLKYNEIVLAIQNKVKELDELTQIFNERFGNKNEEDLSDRDKQKMKDMLAEIEAKKAEIEKLKQQQEAAIAKFNQMVEETKKRLGK
jgi:hypothetical protein